ncbi:hypothetical protein C2G38_2059018 [Gigaspora rosea]|uniref:Uncharacterized protein n=1 Tax=Gigaspora rosea TaxID=44941 RepID=A0A397W1C4_9GLOM|nr:hypothetical protein C2G38_2059018 [Gigaspora rosea]
MHASLSPVVYTVIIHNFYVFAQYIFYLLTLHKSVQYHVLNKGLHKCFLQVANYIFG